MTSYAYLGPEGTFTHEALTRWQPASGHEYVPHGSVDSALDALRSGEVDAAVASLRAHEAYLAHVTDHPIPEEFIPEILRQGGAAAGTDHAVVLRVHEL